MLNLIKVEHGKMGYGYDVRYSIDLTVENTLPLPVIGRVTIDGIIVIDKIFAPFEQANYYTGWFRTGGKESLIEATTCFFLYFVCSVTDSSTVYYD